MNDREKLIMLLGDDTCHRECSECEYHENEKACIRYLKESMADHILANGVTVQKWIPVTERLPEDSATVLVCHKNWFVTTNAWLGANWWFKNEVNPITHWMPLPKAPKDGGAE